MYSSATLARSARRMQQHLRRFFIVIFCLSMYSMNTIYGGEVALGARCPASGQSPAVCFQQPNTPSSRSSSSGVVIIAFGSQNHPAKGTLMPCHQEPCCDVFAVRPSLTYTVPRNGGEWPRRLHRTRWLYVRTTQDFAP